MITRFRSVRSVLRRAVPKVLALVALVAFIAVLPGCEDDPILEPSEVDNGGGGSYGKMRLSSDGYYEIDSLYKTNPEVY